MYRFGYAIFRTPLMSESTLHLCHVLVLYCPLCIASDHVRSCKLSWIPRLKTKAVLISKTFCRNSLRNVKVVIQQMTRTTIIFFWIFFFFGSIVFMLSDLKIARSYSVMLFLPKYLLLGIWPTNLSSSSGQNSPIWTPTILEFCGSSKRKRLQGSHART